MDSISLAKNLISIDTSTTSGKTLDSAKYIKDLLEPKDFPAKKRRKIIFQTNFQIMLNLIKRFIITLIHY